MPAVVVASTETRVPDPPGMGGASVDPLVDDVLAARPASEFLREQLNEDDNEDEEDDEDDEDEEEEEEEGEEEEVSKVQ